MTTKPAGGTVSGVRTIAVPVSDQDRALHFYVQVLGLEKRMDAEVEQIGGRWIEVGAAGAETTIALVPATDANPCGTPTGIRLGTADATALHQAISGHPVEAG